MQIKMKGIENYFINQLPMKTFLRVLYTKILYRIPLKFLLILLAVVAVFIASFSHATISSPVLLKTYDTMQQDKSYTNNNYEMLCIKNYSCDNSSLYFNRTHWASAYISLQNWWSEWYACWFWHTIYFSTNYNCTFYIYWVNSTNYTKAQCKSTYWLIESSECSVMSSLECQTEYSLIPVSSVDQNYCTTNNLCPVCEECQECPVFTWTVSSLYINDILHVGSPLIYLFIPEEIGWDYYYTQWWTQMTIDIEWYNVDYDKIEDIITVQNYKPNSEDFSSLISNVVPLFVPWLCIILLLYFIFRFIKKIF